MSKGGKVAVQADDQVVSALENRALKKRVCELERLLGKKTMEVEILIPEYGHEADLPAQAWQPQGPAVIHHMGRLVAWGVLARGQAGCGVPGVFRTGGSSRP